jgi:hypothetical protein
LSFQRKLELLISKIVVIPATAESQKLLSFQRKLELLISKIVVIPAEAGTPPARFILPGAVFHWKG